MRSAGQRGAIWLGWAISIFFIAWAVMKMDLGQVWRAVAMADYRWIIPSALTNLLILFFRGVRWREFIVPLKNVSVMSAFSALSIGFMANMVMPARIGEIVRAYVIARREKLPRGAAFGTVVIERAFDGLSVVALMLIVFLVVTPPEGKAEFWTNLKAAGMTASAFFIVFFIGMYMFHKRSPLVVWFVDRSTGLMPGRMGSRVSEGLESVRKGLDSIDHHHHLRNVILWSVVVWGFSGPYNYFFFFAFGQDLPFSASYVVMMSQMFGLIVPSAPGFIGVYHAATMAGLMFYGVPAELALSMALVIHITMFTMQTIPGLIFLWMEQYSIRDISHAADEE